METTRNPSVRLYALISARSDEATANEVVTVVEEMVKEKVTTETKQLATNTDLLEGLTGVKKELAEGLAAVRKEIMDVKTDIRKELFEGLAGVRKEISESKADVRKEISEGKAEMIKWMFLFWIGQVAVTFGFILFFLKK